MKKNLVIKITLLISVALIIFAVIVGVVIADNNSRLMNNELIRLTNVYAEYAVITSAEDVAKISDKDKDVRITVIAIDGTVIADSLMSSESLDNHLSRQEIQNALNGNNNSVVIRYSETAKTNLMYYAVKVNIDGAEVFVRASMPSVNMDAYMITAAIIIAVLTVIIIAISVLIANNLAKSSLMPLESVRISLENIKDGKYSNVMPYEKYSEINAMLSSINDVADSLNQTMSNLNKEKLKLQYLTENMAQAVIATDASDKVVMSNAKATTLFGEIDGKNIELSLCDKQLIDAYHSSEVNNITTVVIKNNKKYYRVSVSTTPFDEHEIHKIILITDITKIKLAELERREFFANCSHELKTPLTVIKGYSELLKNKMVKGEKADKYYDSIISDADRLLGMIDDMLTLSRLDEKINGKPQEINVYSRVSEIAKAVSDTDNKGVTYTVKGNKNSNVHMGVANFESLFKNVIENAFKYNKPNGSVMINISESDADITATIKDSGVGISSEDLPRVTDRFYRVNRNDSNVKGYGLGLAIVKHISELSGIDFKIDSTIDIGTTVTLKFKKLDSDK